MQMFKFADDTTLIGLITDNNESDVKWKRESQIYNTTWAASKIIGYDLPTINEIYVSRLQKKV